MTQFNETPAPAGKPNDGNDYYYNVWKGQWVRIN